jgi:hypothetical protein
MTQDYIAIVRIGGGSSYGRGATVDEALARCTRAVRDWDRLFAVYEVPIKAAIYDTTGIDAVHWDEGGTFATDTGEQIKLKELVEFTLPTPKGRRVAA